jgi:methyltransferase
MLLVLALIVFVPMAIEARRAARNERAQRARGGVEPPDDARIYAWMQIVYPGAFAAMLAELAIRGQTSPNVALAGALTFAAAKALKWWAIVTLGSCWTFRVIVVPGAPLVRRGPYRLLRHPNYVAVAGELIGAALMAGAVVTGPLMTLGFLLLMIQRIAVEQRALDAARSRAPASKTEAWAVGDRAAPALHTGRKNDSAPENRQI